MSDLSIKIKAVELGFNIDAIEDGLADMFKQGVGEIAVRAREEWVRLAQNRLKTSRTEYIDGLRQAESFKIRTAGTDYTTYELSLVGKMPNNYEFGMASFDMKKVRPGWLGGAKARTAKDGHKYIVIPFRHSTSSSGSLDYTGKAAAAGMKEKLQKATKEYGLNKMIKAASGQVVQGPVAKIPKNAPVHPYLKNLTRYQTKTGSGTTGQGRLMTFRIMSEKSEPDSWIHPGITAANLLPEVEMFIDNEMRQLLDRLMGERAWPT